MINRTSKSRKRYFNIKKVRGSPKMEQYTRLLSHLRDACKSKKPEVYDGFVGDISVLLSPDKDILKVIDDDIKSILPALLLFSVNKDSSVRMAVIKSFDTFSQLVNRKPSIKSESWWKEMESSIIAQDFSSHLIKLVETTTDDSWPHIWAFVISLIVHDEQVHGIAINSLLKVVEIAFKLSRKHETVLERAYYCWNKLIDIFCVHPRIVTSQKLIELLVRPLSTNLSLKCPKLKLETWNHLLHKVGFACVNTKCKLVIEPFIDFAFLKNSDSLCQFYPRDCVIAFRDVVKEKKLYKYCVTKIMSALVNVFQSGLTEDLNEYLIEIWISVIENSKELEKANQNEYVTELVKKLPDILLIDKHSLNDSLILATLEKNVFCTENMKMFILDQVPVMPIISSLMKHQEFQKHFFPPLVNDLLDHFLEPHNKKTQNNLELELWDLVCEVFILWLKSLPHPQESTAIDAELVCSLLMVPLLSKQWTVPVQRTWSSVMEYLQITVPSNDYLLRFVDRFYKELSESHISCEFAVEICTYLSNKDKSVFKSLMQIFNLISKSLPSKDPKPLMDILVLLENAIRFIPKQDLIKLLTELMSNSNSYGQPYDLRIKTKITKLQRKLFTLKDPNEGNKEQDGQQSKNQENVPQQNGQKTRSPLMAQSNFLHRLAKAEEKKTKKRATMSSIFGDILPQEEAFALSPDQNNVDNKSDLDSSFKLSQPELKDNPCEKEGKDNEEKTVPLMNGRNSPAIPSIVTVVTTPKGKRGVKQSEAVMSQEVKKPSTPKTTLQPPSYFEEEAQDYVIVPPKPKSTPLTEHQKEMLSKRRSDIPALYQDLSQDTQSLNSQSIRELVTQKEIKVNDTAKSDDVTVIKGDKEEVNNTNSKTVKEPKKEGEVEDLIIANGGIELDNNSLEIVNDSQPKHDTGINLSLTPTKHSSAPPAQKNLLNKFNLLECDENGDDKRVDEEDEVEKENKIFNIEEVSSQKSAVKRRSARRSTNKFISKKSEETPKTKLKKESVESSVSSDGSVKGKSKKVVESALKPNDGLVLLETKNNIESEISNKDLENNNCELSEEKEDCVAIVSNGSTEEASANNFEHTEKISENVLEVNGNQEISKKAENSQSKTEEKMKSSSDMTKVILDSDLEMASSDISVQSGSIVCNADIKYDSEPLVSSELSHKISDVSEMSTNISKSPGKTSDLCGSNEILIRSEEQKQNSVELKGDVVKEMNETNIKQPSVLGSSAPDHCPEIENKSSNDTGISSKTGWNVQSSPESCVVEKEIVSNEHQKPKPGFTLDSHESDCIETNNATLVVNAEAKYEAEAMNVDIQSEISHEEKVEDQEDNDQNSSADSIAANWSMVTPEKKSRKRRLSGVNTDKFSPKLLRSKRLSLPKEQSAVSTDGSAEKSAKKSKVSARNSIKVNDSGTDTPLEKKAPENKKTSRKSPMRKPNETDINVISTKPSTSECETDSKQSSPESELSVERKANKRKNQETMTPPSQPKRQKTESNSEEASQDSLTLLKNSTLKPRKKKVIKSNIKSSPSNLEQWLIKSGKSVVKTSLLSSCDQLVSPTESKIINSDSEIQISSSEPKKIIVEMSPVSKNTNESTLNLEENAIKMEIGIDEGTIDTQDNKPTPEISNCAEMMKSEVIDSNGDDEGIPSVFEDEAPKSIHDTNQPEDIESIERQFIEAVKRGAEEEEDSTKRRQEERSRHLSARKDEDDDEDEEELLTESLKCEETELEKSTNELERSNSASSRVKLESMIYAKYNTNLRRPRRRKRLIRRVKKQGDGNDFEEELEEEEETFNERRERLTTPFRPSGGRSAQMVKMATTEEDPPVTPVRGRKSITPLQLTENWPEGRCEQWVPCVPTPPGISPSLGILKKKMSPITSPTSSPNPKKKRVSFLDPPVSKGLLYSKGSDNIGQVQHANIPPGKKPVWQGFEGEAGEAGKSDLLKTEEVEGGFGPVEAEDELNAIQEFLNSTPDAPWKDTPLAGEISKIPGILSCGDPVQNIISRIASKGDEKKLSEELDKLKIKTIGGFCSLTVSDIKRLSIRPAKVPTLYNVLRDYFQCQPSSSKRSLTAKFQEEKMPEECEKMDFVENQIEITTLGIEMGVQVDPSEVCSDETFTLPQMSQKVLQSSQELCVTPPVVKEPDRYSDSQDEVKIPSQDEISLMFQSDVFIKRAAPFVTLNFISKLTAAAAEYLGQKPD